MESRVFTWAKVKAETRRGFKSPQSEALRQQAEFSADVKRCKALRHRWTLQTLHTALNLKMSPSAAVLAGLAVGVDRGRNRDSLTTHNHLGCGCGALGQACHLVVFLFRALINTDGGIGRHNKSSSFH